MAKKIKNGNINIVSSGGALLVDAESGIVYADFIGDGSLISNISLDQLEDVDTTGATVDSVLKYDGTNWVVGTDTRGTDTGVVEGQEYTINIIGNVTGNIATQTIEPSDNTQSITIQPKAGETTNGVFVKSLDTGLSYLNLLQLSDNDISTNTDVIGHFNVVRADSTGISTFTTLNVTKDYLELSHTAGGHDPFAVDQNKAIYNRNGQVGIGKKVPEAKLDVAGNIKIGSFTTTERDALTGSNGMIIYNTTDNKFQGYENGAWANLI